MIPREPTRMPRSRAFSAMNRPDLVLIGGGYDKESVYDEWIDGI